MNVFAFCTLRPIPLPDNPRLTSDDVTVIIPTLDGGGAALWETVRSILATRPAKIVLITIDANLKHAQQAVREMGTKRIEIFSVAQPNKRRQMVRAIPEVQTDITIFADDDVTWPIKLLPWMLAPLETDRYGAVGTNQRLRRAENPSLRQRVWNFLGALYLERRNFDCASCMYMDGGVPCLSGRTVAYRTKILKDPAFVQGFTNEEWLGRYQLNADDDNFITRWLISHGQGIWYQYHKEAEVQTTLEDNSKFLRQCLRWARSNWRSNMTSMFRDRHIWRSVPAPLVAWSSRCPVDAYACRRNHPWSTYAVHLTTLSHWALVGDCVILSLYARTSDQWSRPAWNIGCYALVSWMILSKFLKLLGHYIRYPADFVLLPVSIMFGYLHGLIKAYALLTLNVVSRSPVPSHTRDSRPESLLARTESITCPPPPDHLHGTTFLLTVRADSLGQP